MVFTASLLGSDFEGDGDTPEEAIEELELAFEQGRVVDPGLVVDDDVVEWRRIEIIKATTVFTETYPNYLGHPMTDKNLKLRRAKALLKCRGHRLSGWCQTAPAYDQDGNGRGACGSCGLFIDIKAADLAEGKNNVTTGESNVDKRKYL